MVSVGRILCVIGIHRWETKADYGAHTMREYQRCRRAGCHYSRWMIVNIAKKKW